MPAPLKQPLPESVSILFADVFGYSVLMEKAEQEVCTVTNHCINLFVSTCKCYRGQVHEIAGDGLMIQFNAANDALDFAVAIRRQLDNENTTLSIGEAILFRIGIHTGPVITVPGGIRGHTVNVAARIEQAVPPNRIGLSEATLISLSDREHYQFLDQGYQSLKNIQAPERLYLVDYSSALDAVDVLPQTAVNPRGANAPTLVVSPFRCVNDEAGLGLLQAAINEELLFHFAKRREYRLHAAEFLGVGEHQTDLVARLCRLFSIDYLVEGTLVPSPDGIRLSTRIIFAQTGQVIDSNRVTIGRDTQSEDIMTACVTLSLRAAHQVESFELREITRGLSGGRYAEYLAARKLNRQLTEASNHEARHILQGLLAEGHPEADALVELAHNQHMAWRYGWGDRSEAMLEAAIDSARAAIREDPEHARAHNELGYALLFTNEYDASFENFRIAQDLNPNDPWIMADVATARVYTGDSERAVTLLNRSPSLNATIDLDWRLWSLAEAYFPLKDYQAVVSTIQKMRDPTEGQRLAAASYAMLGEDDKAGRLVEKILKNQPDFSITRWSEMQPDTDDSELEHYANGLAKAGLPR